MAEFDAQPITMPDEHHYVRVLQPADGEELDIIAVPTLDRAEMARILAEHGYDDLRWLPEG